VATTDEMFGGAYDRVRDAVHVRQKGLRYERDPHVHTMIGLMAGRATVQ
jgi:hypothetical protein